MKALMKELWHDPVWSKVIAWIILAVGAAVGTYFFKWWPIIGGFLSVEIPLIYFIAAVILLAGYLLLTLRTQKHPRVTLTMPEASKISECKTFFKANETHRELIIFALTGQRFFEMIKDNRISVENIKLIVPTDKAIRAYYPSNHPGFQLLINDINNIRNGNAKSNLSGLVESISIQEVESFPLVFYAIFDSSLAMSGVYRISETRSHTIGLESRAWVDNDDVSIKERTSQFGRIWNA